MSALIRQEYVLLVLFFLMYMLPLILVMVLRSYCPNRLMIGVFLCLYTGIGQFYLRGGLIPFLLVCSLYGIAGKLLGNSIPAVLAVHVCSAAIFSWRFQKNQEKSLVFRKAHETYGMRRDQSALPSVSVSLMKGERIL